MSSGPHRFFPIFEINLPFATPRYLWLFLIILIPVNVFLKLSEIVFSKISMRQTEEISDLRKPSQLHSHRLHGLDIRNGIECSVVTENASCLNEESVLDFEGS